MDLDIIQSTKEGEITQFLCDVRDYFQASLSTSEYENTSNIFYLTASETTEQLLKRCECLLNRMKTKNMTKSHNIEDKASADEKDNCSVDIQPSKKNIDNEDASYLDMSATHNYNNNNNKKSVGKTIDLSSSGDSDKTFRCSTLIVRQNKSFLHRLHEGITTITTGKADADEEKIDNHGDKIHNFEDDTQIYDICQVTTQGSDGEEDEVWPEETQKAFTQDFHFSLPNIDCPYMHLPAGHLPIKKSVKYGQLLKIEKRLFFDQSKKCYCGILNDWLLCYADGPTSNKPTLSLYLKIPTIEIEHFGEGKRREICFQITTSDPTKRFVFQAVNEIDAKEWIHAIEAAIRSDITDMDIGNSSTRKLPTPPVIKKITFMNNSFQGKSDMFSNRTSCDGIYEEPSSPCQIKTKSICEKQNNSEWAHKFQYDIPKCPPQPFKDNSINDLQDLINPYENGEINSPEKTRVIKLSESVYQASPPPSAQKVNLKLEENLDFQAKVKDVHSKLTSQLLLGPTTKKSFKKTLSPCQNEAESQSPPSSITPLPEIAEMKKQKKTSTTPSNSPQKISNEKSSFAKNWFLNRLNKTTSSTRSTLSTPSNSPSKCKQSEKENLLNSSSDTCTGYDLHLSNLSGSSVSPILNSSSLKSGTSKVNMIIHQLEASGHLVSMLNVDAASTFNSFCDNDFNNYEPIMTIPPTPTNLMKKV